MLRRIHRILLLFALLVGGVWMNYVQAAVYNGNCGANGSNVKWSLNTSTGVLSITGSGAMADWDNTTTPWNSYLSSIQTVKVGSGITRIGSQAFYNCNNLSSVTFTGTTVTSIGQFAFRYCSSLTSITFPSSLTSIEWAAFQMSGLMIVDLPSSFTSLGSGAFLGSTNLKYVIIPSSVTTIKIQAFESCSSLEEIHVKWTTQGAIPAWPSYFTNKTPSSIKLYVPCGKSSLYSAKDGWKNYTIVEETASGVCGSHLIWSLSCDGVLTISGTGAMADWASETNVPWRSYRSSITSVSIANGVTSIGSYAFYGCSKLTSCQIPSSITQIGSNAFRGCSTLTAITIPNSVTSLGAYAFYGCSKLKEVTLSENLTEIKSCTFQNCSSLVSITIPNGVINVGWASFYGCAALTNIYVSWTENIPSWGPPTNKSPQSSITLHVPCGTKSLYQAANGWKNYTLTETTIGGNCGASGNNLTWSFCIGTGTLTISGSGAMKDYERTGDNCAEYSSSAPWIAYKASITSIVLPCGLTHIGNYAFYQCRGITDIDLPAALLSIGGYAFAETGLQQVCLPEGVTTIGNSAFSNMCFSSNSTPLKRVYLPNSLTSIGNYALSYNPLMCLTYPASANSFSTPYRGQYPAKEIYASWKTDIPTRQGRVEAVASPRLKMHIPYGTTALYRAKDWARIYQLVEDVDERAIDLGLSIRWASCNIGANAPEENGNFYAWGDTITRSSFTWGTYPYSGTSTNTMTKYCTRAANGTVDNRSTLIAFDDAAYINWGETWRMPTWAEWNELITRCTWKDTTINNVSVWQVTGPNGNSIYLPKVGYKNNSSVTAGCYYWSSTLNTANSNDQCNRALYINAADRSGAKYGLRYVGMPVRAVYRREWPSFTLTITDTPEGTSYTKAVNAAGTYTLTAKEDDCRTFVRWSDGNTDNPRTVTVTADASYTAEYETRHGTCGATGNEANVTWSLSCDSTLTISGTGEMADYMEGEAPWYPYREAIKYFILFGSEIANIGDAAFYNCPNLIGLSGAMPCTVKIVGKKSFMNCPQMKHFTLCFGDNTAIKDSAFYNCSNLGSFTLMGDIVHIGKRAFYNCTNLITTELPKTITYIGEEAFYNCPNVNDLRVHWTENIPAWNNITNMDGIVLRIPCGTRALYDAADGWKDYTIIEGALAGTYGSDIRWTYNICDSTLVISGTGAMMNAAGVSSGPLGGMLSAYRDAIKTVVIKEGITNIGYAAFSKCTKLTSVTIPNSVTSIGWASFYQCKSLKSITIPNSVVNLNYNNVFEQCYALTDLYFSWTENVPEYNSTIFRFSSAPKTIHIPCGTTALYEEQGWANSLCTLEDHVISGTCGADGDNLTWTLCTTDSTLTISGTGAMADYSAGGAPWNEHKDAIHTVTFADGINTIGENAFADFTNLTDIYAPWTDNIPALPASNNPQPSVRLHIACSAISDYQAAGWGNYTIEGEGGPYTVTVQAADPTMGDVNIVVN